MLFDYSKTNLDAETRETLLEFACVVPEKRDAMFSGSRINETEDRPCFTRRCATRKAS